MINSLRFPVILLWCLHLFLSYTLSSSSHATPTTNTTDLLALLAIKSQIHDPSGATSSWNNSVPLCWWTGVLCGHRHQRVTALNLRNRNIEGQLSPFVGNLTFLKSINLGGNKFYGDIPNEIGRLFRLKVLILGNNSFSGTIPKNLSHCINLRNFFATKNNLVGEIPSELGYLSKLEKLAIAENHLTGQVPTSIGNLSALQAFDLGVNNLGDRIPDTFAQLKSLVFLTVSQNNFFGTFPPVYNISSLEKFSLYSNRFNGSLPLEIGLNLPNLNFFNVAQNNFTGSLPGSLFNASKLEVIDLSKNHFRGKVPNSFGSLKNLSVLHLGANKLGTGSANDLEFVTSLTNCSNLETLALYENQFEGVLPHSIANLSTTVTTLVIGSNQFSGIIPPGIRNLVNLTSLAVEFNQLTGTIPYVIGELKKLQLLYLSANHFQGSIPTSLGNLTRLTKLVLGSNNLTGFIPSSFENCQNLFGLDLSKNKLISNVPRQLFGITTLVELDLSNNLLSGPLPLEVGSLKNLLKLVIVGNQFSGQIPVTLGGCTSLEYLYMQNNSFNGGIPSSMSSLRSIKELDLSFNNLSDQIPKFLENASFLVYLNLSYNHFDGEVPIKGVFNKTTNISVNGNENLCGGIAELHLPSCKSKKSMMVFLKVLIPVIISCLILLSTLFIIVVSRKRKSVNRTSRMLDMEEQFPMVSYLKLSRATNGFSSSNMIGQGSYGIVYKGLLENGTLVAVKVINLQQKGASKSFMAECNVLRNIRHRNLIKIITICSSIDAKGDDFKALVYVYMENGSLEEWLHPSSDQPDARNLSVVQRLNIAIDVASGIEYLHHRCQPPIIHGDLKPSNVLLDRDMVAHVSDFGLAKFLPDQPTNTNPETPSSSVGINGTIGYVAPEYGMGTEVSILGDMYSFGVLLLEMFTRKRPTDRVFNDGLTLRDFVITALPERAMEIVDPSLQAEVSNNNAENFTRHREGRDRTEDCLAAVLRLGVLCSTESPPERMQMTDVVGKLCAIRECFAGRRINLLQ